MDAPHSLLFHPLNPHHIQQHPFLLSVAQINQIPTDLSLSGAYLLSPAPQSVCWEALSEEEGWKSLRLDAASVRRFFMEADAEGCWQLPDTMKQHEGDGRMTGESSGERFPSSSGARHASDACRGSSSATRPHSERTVAALASPATLTTGTWET